MFNVKVLRTLILISTGIESVKGKGLCCTAGYTSVVSLAVIMSVNVTVVVT